MTSWPIAFWMTCSMKSLTTLKIHVRFEQGGADILHGFADVFFADSPAAGKGAEYAAEFVGECVEHRLLVG